MKTLVLTFEHSLQQFSVMADCLANTDMRNASRPEVSDRIKVTTASL
ncbi:hypothetical protein [Bradyrhizobium sp. 156]|nr:hypothetical protein [Bradyrhizobium sp. 156]